MRVCPPAGRRQGDNGERRRSAWTALYRHVSVAFEFAATRSGGFEQWSGLYPEGLSLWKQPPINS